MHIKHLPDRGVIFCAKCGEYDAAWDLLGEKPDKKHCELVRNYSDNHRCGSVDRIFLHKKISLDI